MTPDLFQYAERNAILAAHENAQPSESGGGILKARCSGKNHVRGCRNFSRKHGADCCRCHMRAWRRNQPYRAAYATLRDHARERGIEFAISFDQFFAFAVISEYVELKGNEAESLTVDRKDNLRGYVPGNIQPMTRANNSVKRAKSDAVRMRCGFAWQSAA